MQRSEKCKYVCTRTRSPTSSKAVRDSSILLMPQKTARPMTGPIENGCLLDPSPTARKIALSSKWKSFSPKVMQEMETFAISDVREADCPRHRWIGKSCQVVGPVFVSDARRRHSLRAFPESESKLLPSPPALQRKITVLRHGRPYSTSPNLY